MQNKNPDVGRNAITLTFCGVEEAIFGLNGKVLNRIGKMSYEMDGKRAPSRNQMGSVENGGLRTCGSKLPQFPVLPIQAP